MADYDISLTSALDEADTADCATDYATDHAIDHANAPADGILPASADSTQYRCIGINQAGELYLYGPTPREPGPTVPALMGLVCDCLITQHGEAGARGGNAWDASRDHLTLRLLAPDPTIQNVLRLPANRGQWSYRSLLGALVTLDLRSTAVKIEPRKGREATFFRVSTDARGLNVVTAPGIGPERSDLEIAVDHVRRNLGLESLYT
jgi:hypothetical protein